MMMELWRVMFMLERISEKTLAVPNPYSFMMDLLWFCIDEGNEKKKMQP